ncbi:glycosyltransferase family 4 protein [Staphylococcus haemolyticus]|uniref:glycosyltransferase family 4 protein n=1 Tax=Staphylococcus haemolyticus TaxID=1283 RepID=UPI000F85C599|nr:glycosyltransferase family 4 protein [Staphylococcus haemolyticus]MCH4351759.1 glycosyltransferase family 4 protein [Staphylococcus haemolyticus]MCH4388450.1 glycosyltransferase family 4 protein [Staphylococcus haemolyticus]MCH4483978.1 glycosyltransferase family 4 protein [Staphylococcus haemolyticus]MCI2934625.1 glycosyltransferase family 4 protein [Staphylococcus haemolyticus]MEB7320912.1 glycosyltransferase family 4 protein [Staphylococcus haemolyticus]
MKILFIHDFPAYYDKNKNEYYSTGFSYSIWQRYLKVFDELNVVSRFKEINDENHDYNISSGQFVKFSPIKEYTNFTSLIKNSRKINRKLTKEILNSDGVIIRLPSVLGFLSAMICKKANKPYLVEVVGSMFDAYWNYGNLLSKFLAFPGELIQKQTVKNSDVAIYITKDYLQSKYPTKGNRFDSISNVVLDDDFDEKVNRKYKINNKPIRLGLVGSTYVHYKGHDLAIEALSILLNKGYDITLDFVGQGLSDNVKEMISKYNLNDRVYYKGVINSRNKMDEWYKSLDIYIQPSKTEGHGRAVVEAIGNGVTVIASNVGGLPDSVQKRFLFSSKDVYQFVEMIETCINSFNNRKENIDGNINKVLKYKKSTIQLERLEALTIFKDLIGGKN